ncbi:unnamed protein product, partial [Meganyctiphanes norvegica]
MLTMRNTCTLLLLAGACSALPEHLDWGALPEYPDWGLVDSGLQQQQQEGQIPVAPPCPSNQNCVPYFQCVDDYMKNNETELIKFILKSQEMCSRPDYPDAPAICCNIRAVPEPLSFVKMCPFQSNNISVAQWFKLEKYKVYNVNLSDIINCIEPVNNIDIFQLFLESLITLLSVAANTLTIVVIWEVSLSHPAQALRVAMAVFDLLQGLFGCGMAVWNHSYYLWCASKPERCVVQVNVISREDGELFILHCKLNVVLSLIYWSSISSSYFLLVFMTVDRYVAICFPLKYHLSISIRKTRIAIAINWMTNLFFLLVFFHCRANEIVWKAAYNPLTKTMNEFMIKKSLLNTNYAIHVILIIAIITCMVSLSVLILYQLKKASTRIKSLKEGMDETPGSTEDIDFNKTLVISMMVEVLSVLVLILASESIVMFSKNNKTSGKMGASKEFSLYIYFTQWFVLSSTFFNFLLYNLRIPAFRSKSLNIIKNGVKSC